MKIRSNMDVIIFEFRSIFDGVYCKKQKSSVARERNT